MKGHSGGCPEGRCSPGLEYQTEGTEERWNPESCILPPWAWETRQGWKTYMTLLSCVTPGRSLNLSEISCLPMTGSRVAKSRK